MVKRYRVLTLFAAESKFDGSIVHGKIDGEVRGKAAALRQIEHNRAWLKAKGHTEKSSSYEEVK